MRQDEIEAHIQREVARRSGQQAQSQNAEIESLRKTVDKCRADLAKQRLFINQMSGTSLRYATVLDIQDHVDPAVFRPDDDVVVIDRNSPHFYKAGKVAADANSGEVVTDGQVWVVLEDHHEVRFHIGVEGGERAQIRLVDKADGSKAVIAFEGKPWEINTVIGFDLKVGDTVSINEKSKQIVGPGREYPSGGIHTILAVTDYGVEIDDKGDRKIVANPKGLELEEGDRVVLSEELTILRKVAKDARRRYKVSQDLNVTWDSVGGLIEQKEELKDILEAPYQDVDLYDFYKVKPCRGVLFYGPPGCGKTLLARVCAWAIAQQHGKEALDGGYIYVKSPEILDKWVGNTEAEIRNLFERGRRHYREHGYKAVLAFDEFDAIAPQRGTRRSSDVADTIVPMFLGEMDGLDEQQTRENPMLILMTNRADILDPAVTRAGRIDKHIRIGRPDEGTSIDVLKIHTDALPFQRDSDRLSILAVAVADLFSKSRALYRVNGDLLFTLGDACSGALLASLASTAQMNALRRDRAKGTKTGLTVDDFRQGVEKLCKQQQGMNHSFDLYDFAEKHGIQPQNMKIERCFGSGG